MNDQQFDSLVRASLAWQAERAVTNQPPLRVAVRRLIVAIDSSPSGPVRFKPGLATPRLSFAQLLLLVVLLLAMLGVALFVGAWLRDRLEQDSRPRVFGYAAPCDPGRIEGGAVMVFSSDGVSTYLYPDGRLLTDASSPTMAEQPTAPRAEIVRGTGYLERQLSTRGIELMLGRVTEAGLTEGCHRLRSTSSTGTVFAQGSAPGLAETVGAEWSTNAGSGAFGVAREMSADEELALTELIADLGNPSSWLPADAWSRPDETHTLPSDWLVLVSLAPTGLGPTDRLRLPEGGELAGSDPRYALIVLPGGVEPALFGTETGADAGQTHRCGVVSRADAIRLAESIDEQAVGYHSYGDGWLREGWGGGLFTPDLSIAVALGIAPRGTFPGLGETTCAGLAAPTPSVLPTPTPALIAGDLAEVDPCSLVPADIGSLREPFSRRSAPSRVNLAVPARECGLQMGSYIGRAVSVTLYPRSIDRTEAGEVVDSVLGIGLSEKQMGRVVVWANSCYAQNEKCAPGVAISAPPYLLVVTAEPYVSKLVVRDLVDALVRNLSN